MTPKTEKPAPSKQGHFKNGSYSITPKYLRQYRNALCIHATSLSIIDSLFGYFGKSLEVYPSIKTLSEEADCCESTAWWHLKYLHAHDLLPIRHVKRDDGTVRSFYDLTPLRDFNQSVMEAVKAGDPLPLKFPVGFTQWRQTERKRQKGGKRGCRKSNTTPVLKRGFGVPKFDDDDFCEKETPGREAEYIEDDPVSESPADEPIKQQTEDVEAQRQTASARFELDLLSNWIQDIRNAVRGVPQEYERVRGELKLSEKDFARAVNEGKARDEVFAIDLDGHKFLFGRALEPASTDDAQLLENLRDSLRCGPEDIPEELKDHEKLVAAVQDGVFHRVAAEYEVRPSVFSTTASPLDIVTLRDALLAEAVPPHLVLVRLVGEVAARYMLRARTVAEARRADLAEVEAAAQQLEQTEKP